MHSRHQCGFLSALLISAPFYAAAQTGSGPVRVTDLSSVADATWKFKPEGGDWKTIAVSADGWRTQGYTCDAGTYRATLTLAWKAFSGDQTGTVLAEGEIPLHILRGEFAEPEVAFDAPSASLP